MPAWQKRAAADAASHNFQHDSVLCCLDERNDRLFRIVGVVHFHYQLFGDCFFCMGICSEPSAQWFHLLYKGHRKRQAHTCLEFPLPVLRILSAAAFRLIFLIAGRKLKVNYLSLSHVEKVEEFSDRFWIVGAGAASDYKRILFVLSQAWRGI